MAVRLEQVVPDGGDFEYTAAGYTSSGYGQALNRFEAMNGASWAARQRRRHSQPRRHEYGAAAFAERANR